MNQLSDYSIWRPFTQMKNAEPALKVRSGSGVFLELEDGRKIVDCISSWWVNLHGHSHPAIAEAVYKQAQTLEHVIFAGFTHEPAEQVAAGVSSLLPEPLKHVFFSDNGSTSVEIALKTAYQYWLNTTGTPRHRFIGFEGGYHGDTIGAMSIGGSAPFWKPFASLMFAIDVAPYPQTWETDQDSEEKEKTSLAELSRLLESHPGEYAAICIEPLVQGAGGMRMCRPQFLQNLAALAVAHNTLLIYDEVMTGFGRTGDYFAALKSDTTPDIICVSKGITGGFMPLALTVSNQRVFDAFLSDDHSKTFFHGHSYTANPLACAAAVASLALLKADQTLFKEMEAQHRLLFSKHLSGHPLLKQERFCGTIFAAEVVSPDQSGYFSELGPQLRRAFLEQDILVRPLGNTIYLMPPYCIDSDTLTSVYMKIRTVLDSLSN